MMSVAPPSLSTLMFSPDPGHQGAGAARTARPGPAQLLHTAQSLPGSPSVKNSDCERRVKLCHGDRLVTPVYHHQWGGALCLLWWASVSINRSLRDKVWWELLKSPSVNPWDVFLVVISLRISSIYYCFSIEHSNCHSVDDDTSFSRSGWHYSRITQSSDSSPGNTSSGVITLQQPSSGHSHVPECLRLPTLKWTLNSE